MTWEKILSLKTVAPLVGKEGEEREREGAKIKGQEVEGDSCFYFETHHTKMCHYKGFFIRLQCVMNVCTVNGIRINHLDYNFH